MSEKIAIHWFRQDLRIQDNPSLHRACENGLRVFPIYILDDIHSHDHKMGATSRVWLHHSLKSLDQNLDNHLSLYQGDPLEILDDLIERYDVDEIHWNRCYEPWRTKRDETIKSFFKKKGIHVESHNGSLLWEPWDIKKNDGTPYKVFTPFYRKGCLNAPAPRLPIGTTDITNTIKDTSKSLNLSDLNLLPQIPWDKDMISHWDISEDGAITCLHNFIDHGLSDYKEGRNIPSKNHVSRLSPYLHFGQISPHTAWHSIIQQGENKNTDHFCSELGWREFSYSLLFHNPDLPWKNFQDKFDRFPWQDHDAHLSAWQKGQTGIPMVDAGIRELWQTGYMHNRVRMIVGSFLVKNLLIDWRQGERWFWDCLFDADLANNSASWQWIAGCGADAAPYFRIFNCVTQGQKFDPDGDYIRHFIPELTQLPSKYIHSPWEAPPLILKGAGIDLGKTYPTPIVDLKQSRERALDAFQSLKQPET